MAECKIRKVQTEKKIPAKITLEALQDGKTATVYKNEIACRLKHEEIKNIEETWKIIKQVRPEADDEQSEETTELEKVPEYEEVVGCMRKLKNGKQMTRKITEWEPDVRRPKGRPKTRWREQVEQDLRIMEVKNWNKPCRDRKAWRQVVSNTKTHPSL
ncbi:hypothetical protein ILUMI_11277 [Ignelater luminosus]|uniref:Endonuclease-reverse transcriptase n=1 Tax=Ignelater luminosus TaxID=2038154 RepID=A0A8K0GCV2_IGNLU|nr:hypothetical protein ILUMI_11277 [Ignelater luminosus]